MDRTSRELATLVFDGPRHEHAGLDIEDLPELIAYKRLLVELSKTLWRQDHPEARKLPKGYEDSIRLMFDSIGTGSTVVVLKRVQEYEPAELPLQGEDEVDAAAELIDRTTAAIAESKPLPQEISTESIHLFQKLGEDLGEGECIRIQSHRSDAPVTLNSEVHEKTKQRVERTYEDSVDVIGEVRLADLDGCKFVLRLNDGQKPRGKFAPEQESLITDALRNHSSVSLRVKGRGEFSRENGRIVRFSEVEEICLQRADSVEFDPSARPIWEIAEEIGASIPEEDWEKVPRDLAENLDHYLYGLPRNDG